MVTQCSFFVRFDQVVILLYTKVFYAAFASGFLRLLDHGSSMAKHG